MMIISSGQNSTENSIAPLVTKDIFSVRRFHCLKYPRDQDPSRTDSQKIYEPINAALLVTHELSR